MEFETDLIVSEYASNCDCLCSPVRVHGGVLKNSGIVNFATDIDTLGPVLVGEHTFYLTFCLLRCVDIIRGKDNKQTKLLKHFLMLFE